MPRPEFPTPPHRVIYTFLDRVAALRDGSDAARANTRTEDRAAAELLAARRGVAAKLERDVALAGLSKRLATVETGAPMATSLDALRYRGPEEARLRGLIAEATSLADMPAPLEPDPSDLDKKASALQGWLRDWRETARVLVTRRDYQIRLGLAERRMTKGGEGEEGSLASD